MHMHLSLHYPRSVCLVAAFGGNKCAYATLKYVLVHLLLLHTYAILHNCA